MSTRGTYRTGAIVGSILAIEVIAWGIGLAFWLSASRYLPQFRVERPEVLWGLLAGPFLVLAVGGGGPPQRLRQLRCRVVARRHRLLLSSDRRAQRPGARVLISCSSQPLPSGSLKEAKEP